MTDSPGWASPGSSPSDPKQGGDEPADGAAADPPHAAPGAEPPRNWSAQQPPPAQGGGWGAQPPPGPAGWGGQPGFPGWNQPPTAAKPGVIPLRPLGVGEILDGAVSTARAHWRTALGVALLVAVLMELVSTLATGFLLKDDSSLQSIENNPRPSTDELVSALSTTLSAVGISSVATLLGTVIATAMLTVVVSRAVLGRPVTTGDTWREAAPQIVRMLGLTLLVGLIVVGAFVVGVLPGMLLSAAGSTGGGVVLGMLGGIAGLVAGVWLWVRYSLAAPALILEKQNVAGAMRRSAKLVRGSWWRIFGVQLLALVLVKIVVTLVVQIPTMILASTADGHSLLGGSAYDFGWTYLSILAVGGVIGLTITLPFSSGITALLYMDQRIRREALDLELARAAGVGEAGSPQGDAARPAPES
jgi:hypothetical protein